MSDNAQTERDVVSEWLEAVNGRDVVRLLDLSASDIAIIGPRGRSRGHQALREWLAAAGLSVTSRRRFQKDDMIVVEQHAMWRSPATLNADSFAAIACRFRVCGGRVTEIERYDSLEAALLASGLTSADECR